jgi:glycosyltransferase involved in cell wall biosynthesis
MKNLFSNRIKETSPRISVIVPLYNHERYICHALESVYTQSVLPKEVIVIDDGSDDTSMEIAIQFAASHPEMIVWSHPNQGAHYTINSGIHRATGEFVAILNSDDAYFSNRFAECLNVFDINPEITAICTGLAFIDESGNPIQNSWYEQARAFYNQVDDLSLALINGNFFMTTSNLIIRRTVFDEIGYFSNLRYAHDLDFFLRLLLRGKKIYFNDKPLISYRIHALNTISEDVLRVKVEWAAAVAFFIYNRWQRDQNWDYLAKLTDITDRHNLTRLLVYFFAFYDSLPSDKISCDAFTQDEKFTRFIYRVAR